MIVEKNIDNHNQVVKLVKKQELNIRENIVKNINKYVKQKNGKKNIEIIIIPKKVEKEKD